MEVNDPSTLGTDLFANVLHLIDAEQVNSLSLVSKRCNLLSSTDNVWKPLFLETWPHGQDEIWRKKSSEGLSWKKCFMKSLRSVSDKVLRFKCGFMKLVVLGDEAVGKSSFIHHNNLTKADGLKDAILSLPPSSMFFQKWRTFVAVKEVDEVDFEEDYSSVDGVFAMFHEYDRKSFDNLRNIWIPSSESQSMKLLPLIVVANSNSHDKVESTEVNALLNDFEIVEIIHNVGAFRENNHAMVLHGIHRIQISSFVYPIEGLSLLPSNVWISEKFTSNAQGFLLKIFYLISGEHKVVDRPTWISFISNTLGFKPTEKVSRDRNTLLSMADTPLDAELWTQTFYKLCNYADYQDIFWEILHAYGFDSVICKSFYPRNLWSRTAVNDDYLSTEVERSFNPTGTRTSRDFPIERYAERLKGEESTEICFALIHGLQNAMRLLGDSARSRLSKVQAYRTVIKFINSPLKELAFDFVLKFIESKEFLPALANDQQVFLEIQEFLQTQTDKVCFDSAIFLLVKLVPENLRFLDLANSAGSLNFETLKKKFSPKRS